MDFGHVEKAKLSCLSTLSFAADGLALKLCRGFKALQASASLYPAHTASHLMLMDFEHLGVLASGRR